MLYKITTHKQIKSTHTGLDMVRQILQMFYCSKHFLFTEKKDGFFHVELRLMVERDAEGLAERGRDADFKSAPAGVKNPGC